MAPRRIGRYEIKEELRHGDAATVYRAYDPSFDREVAIKVLPREFIKKATQERPQFLERFQREIKTASLEHPAIVPVYDTGEEGGLPYFVMRYMPGGSLSDWLDKSHFSLEDTARIVERIAQALSYAHRKGIIHRDIKPDNILFDDTDTAFISDFGVAKLIESVSTSSGLNPDGLPAGTPAYVSPEQVRGDAVDERSDIYSLGVLVYQMLTGRQPYVADTAKAITLKHLNEPIPEILKAAPDLPPEVDTIIKTAMAKDKDDRYPTALDLSRKLNLAAFGTEGSSPTSPLETRFDRGAPGAMGIMAPIIGGAVLLAIAAGVFFFRNQIFVQVEPTATPPPTFTALPPTATLNVTLAPVVEVQSTKTTIPLAPQCVPQEIPEPVVPDPRETNKVCSLKTPFTTISIPANSSFVAQSPGLKCQQERVIGDRILISCTGRELMTYDLKLCFPPPYTPSVHVGKCAESDIYNEANQCCYPAPPLDAGCMIFKVDMRACS
ncbi:MAG: serine/threonine-protein kinase [Chloroflexota bacterium]